METLIRIVHDIGRIVLALNDPVLLNRWLNFPFPSEVLLIFQAMARSAQMQFDSEGERWIESVASRQGENVHLNLTKLRNRDYFVKHWREAGKEYCLHSPKGFFRPRKEEHPLLTVDFGCSFVDLGEYAQGIEIEVDGMKGVREISDSEIPFYWSECPELKYRWECEFRYRKGCYAKDHDFYYCHMGRGGRLPKLYQQLIEHYDKLARECLEARLENVDEEDVDELKGGDDLILPDYSKLRKEVLESDYPADQLLSLYIVGRAQNGDRQAAGRIVDAYYPEWSTTAKKYYNKYGFSKAMQFGLIDILGIAQGICIASIMGNNLEVVLANRGLESPFSIDVLTTTLRPEVLRKRYLINRDGLPIITSVAMLIYLTNRHYGNPPTNVTPAIIGGKQPLDQLSTPDLQTLGAYCTHVLFYNSLGEIVTSRDPLQNYGRFNPAEDGWNLSMFLSNKVHEGLRAVYERKEISTIGKRFRHLCGESCPERGTCEHYQLGKPCQNPKHQRVPWASLTDSLQKPLDSEEEKGATLGDTIPDLSTNFEERVISMVDGATAVETLLAQLNKVEKEILWLRLEFAGDITDEEVAGRLGKERSTITKARNSVRKKAENIGLRDIIQL